MVAAVNTHLVNEFGHANAPLETNKIVKQEIAHVRHQPYPSTPKLRRQHKVGQGVTTILVYLTHYRESTMSALAEVGL